MSSSESNCFKCKNLGFNTTLGDTLCPLCNGIGITSFETQCQMCDGKGQILVYVEKMCQCQMMKIVT